MNFCRVKELEYGMFEVKLFSADEAGTFCEGVINTPYEEQIDQIKQLYVSNPGLVYTILGGKRVCVNIM